VPTPREQLAGLLKQSRLDAGFESHGSLAKRLNLSRPVVSKAENPAQPAPSDALLASWAGATGVGLDTLMDLALRCKSGTPEWFMPYRQAEAEATTIRSWAPMVVPGLAQCESYARAVLSAEPYSPNRLAELVAARIERQQVLSCAHLVAVLDSGVLRRCIGSASIMAEQCDYLAGLAERPNVSVHLVPEGTNTGAWAALDIATRGTTATGPRHHRPRRAPAGVRRRGVGAVHRVATVGPRADTEASPLPVSGLASGFYRNVYPGRGQSGVPPLQKQQE
jgi:transcriptional regulator with XRE-family HTH domain